MMTCVKKVLFWGICIAFVLLAIVLFAASSANFLFDVWAWIIKLGGGNWWIGVLMFLLALLGVINTFRGALKNMEADDSHLKLNKVWKIAIYILLTLLGYICMIIAIPILFHLK